jgi:ABC-type transporter Mla subunit MlaD
MFLEAQLAGEDFTQKFADNFSEMMRTALVAQIKDQMVMKAVADFYEQFGAMSSDAEGLTADERNQLQAQWLAMIASLDAEWQTLVESFPDLFAVVSDAADTTTGSDQSTAGAIKNIQEETANILAGHLGNMRINLASLVSMASKHLDVLNRMDGKLGKIEQYTRETRDALQNSGY